MIRGPDSVGKDFNPILMNYLFQIKLNFQIKQLIHLN